MIKKIVLFLGTILILSGCIKKDCNIPNNLYEFEIPATLSPAKITYKIGDTISVVSRFPHQVYERNTQRTYDLADYKFNPELDIWEMSNEIINKAVLNDFEVIVDTSVYNFNKFYFSDGTIIYEGNYLNISDEYLLEYKVIPIKIGLYLFAFSTFSGSSTLNQPFPEKCSNIESVSYAILNAGQDNNPHLLLESGNEYHRTTIYSRRKDDFNGFGSYMFYVEE